MEMPLPLTRDLVLIGGGHAHALVLRMWGMKPLAGVRVTLVNPAPATPYTGMLPGVIAGHYALDDIMIDLVRLARFAGARILIDRAVGLDFAGQQIALASGRSVRFDVGSIDIGVTSDMPEMPGFGDYGVAAKPMDRFAAKWRQFTDRARAGAVPPQVAVVGGGIGGVEIAMAAAHALRDLSERQVTLIEKDRILAGQNPTLATALRDRMADADIAVREGTEIRRIHADRVELTGGQFVASHLTVTSIGARPQGWLAATGLALENGFIKVDQTLKCDPGPALFAAGDCAYFAPHPHPKAGVYAVRAAPVLFENLRAILSGGPLGRFRPQTDFLKLVSLGSKTALAEKWGRHLAGPSVWRLKDRIDRRFMNKFHDLTPMSSSPIPDEVALDVMQVLGPKPLCGGCGAKVGGALLQAELSTLPAPTRADILTGPGDDAAALAGPDGKVQVLSTDHLRSFTEDTWTQSRIAAIHALGDIWAMGAAPQAALATLILPRMSLPLQQNTLSEIMTAAAAIFAEEGAAIIGGHTSIGAELTIGFTVTGIVDRQITLAGAVPGDRLILTKPIGTGTVLAAEMALTARGEWVVAALDSMGRSQGAAARILAPFAHAMTDVTGFGLAGHAMTMARASGVRLAIDLLQVPYLPGAEALAATGIRSTIFADNLALAPQLLDASNPRNILLFDPQTAGGLLAAVPAEAAATLLRQLDDAGFKTAIIGEVTAGQPGLKLS